ncbi:hypothetical protein, partial [Mesorhizobium sp. M0895]|uniref:hypothetical protein n=1 Tax=Mesorhizobium sp. M0895 TaxID=2957019 RepID=UPI003338586F
IADYGFLVSLRETIPPSIPTRAQGRQTPGLPDGYRQCAESSANWLREGGHGRLAMFNVT